MNGKLKVVVGNKTFLISSFCSKKIGMTENMKFRLECPKEPMIGGIYDDYRSVMKVIDNYLFTEVMKVAIYS